MKKKNITKSMALLLLTILVAGACIGTTLAYITDGTEAVTNTMTPGTVTTAVKETFDGTTKSNVQIQNTGNTDAYIRAAVIVTWQKVEADGTVLVYGEKPVEGTHYTIDLNVGEEDEAKGWIKGSDGFYYHKEVVGYKEGENLTDALINSCTTKKATADGETEAKDVRPENLPADYKLCVEIIGSGIQAKGVADNGKAVVVEEWGVTLSDGTSGNITAVPAVIE